MRCEDRDRDTVAAVGTVTCPCAAGGWPHFSLSLGLVGAFPGEKPPVCLHPEAEELLGHGWRQQEGECPPVTLVLTRVGCGDNANGCPCPPVQEASAGVDPGAPGAGDFLEDQLHRVRTRMSSVSRSRCCCPRHCWTGTGVMVASGCGGDSGMCRLVASSCPSGGL